MVPRDCLFLVGLAEGVALLLGITHQAIVIAKIPLQPLVLVVLLLAAELSPTALLQDDHGKAGRRQLFRHNAAGGSGADDNEVNVC